MQRTEFGCFDFMLWGLCGVGVTLLVSLSAWVAPLLGVHPAVVAFPLTIAPILILAGREWRSSWVFVIPAIIAVLLVLPIRTAPWHARALMASLVFLAWFMLYGFVIVRLLLRLGIRRDEPPGQGTEAPSDS